MACLFMICSISYSQQIKTAGPPPYLKKSIFESYADLVAADAPSDAETFAKKHNLQIADGTIVLVAEAQVTDSNFRLLLERAGATILARHDKYYRLAVPTAQMTAFAHSAAQFIRMAQPLRPVELVTTEGVALTAAMDYIAQGWDGNGVKVAVIDGGFGDLAAAMSAGELPATAHQYDFTGSGIGGSTHGTMVAEIVYDMAPQIELYLMKIGDSIDLGNAVDTCISRGVHIINHSMGWLNAGPLDGTGPVCAIVDAAHNNGILWVNAAGNQALRHYREVFTDSDGDDWHDFENNPSVDELNELGFINDGAIVRVYLSWNDWWLSDQDYDLYLYYYDTGLGDWVVYASSQDPQTGAQWPVESISTVMDRAADIAVGIHKSNAGSDHELTLFTEWYDLEYYHEQNSLLIPADAQNAFSVGAVAASQ